MNELYYLSADALKQAGAHLIVNEIDPKCALQDIIMVNHIRKMEDNGDHFDKEIAMHDPENYPGVKRITVKPQIHRNQVMVELKLWKEKRSRNRGVMKI
ncbi:Adenosylhomocysteinase [Gossypium arboreum]|uniref:Adenosylhomocysteinase n=1 Tax=Gossypium arboreum TaxID=29729 RepID=A0A0B0N4R3_GOSAR|nr:Adenosylhomocysteinase [Gossypium arboreum]